MGKVNFNLLRNFILFAANSYIVIFTMILIFDGKLDAVKPLYLGIVIAVVLTGYLSKKKVIN